jgi:hypothetical protein
MGSILACDVFVAIGRKYLHPLYVVGVLLLIVAYTELSRRFRVGRILVSILATIGTVVLLGLPIIWPYVFSCMPTQFIEFVNLFMLRAQELYNHPKW